MSFINIVVCLVGGNGLALRGTLGCGGGGGGEGGGGGGSEAGAALPFVGGCDELPGIGDCDEICSFELVLARLF